MNLRDIVISQEEYAEEAALELTPEQAEVEIVADDVIEGTDEVIAESEEIEGYTEELGEATEEIEDIEAVEASLTEQLADENYEGMDEVAVEMLNRKLSRIQAKYGLSSKDAKGVIAKEHFTGKSGMRRRTNTQIALEELTATLKKWWESIKAAAVRAWNAVVEFVKRWFTEMGRLEADLKKLKTSVSGMSDITSKEVDSNSAVNSVFGNLGSVNKDSIVKLMDEQKNATQRTAEFVKKNQELFNKLSGDVKADSTKEVVSSAVETGKFEFGSKESPLATGFYGTAEYKADESGESAKLEFKKEKVSGKSEAGKITTGSKEDLLAIIGRSLVVIEESRKVGDSIKKANGDLKKQLADIEKAAGEKKDKTDADKENSKSIRAVGKLIVSINSGLSAVNSTILGLNMKAVRGAIAYVKLSANGKASETKTEDKKEETKEDKKD